MNRSGFILLAGWLMVATAHAAPDPRRALAEGEKAFVKTNFNEAARLFSTAAEGARAAHLDPAVPYYNRGVALLQDGQVGPAAEQFQTAARTSNLDLQQRALFNRGNALFLQAGALEKEKQAEPALKTMSEAQAMYEQAMTLRPKDLDPKVNYELASREKERLEKLVQQQQQQQQQNQNQQQKQDEQKKQDQQNPSSQDKQSPQNQPKPENGDDQKKQDQEQQNQNQAGSESEEKKDQDQKDQQAAAGQEMTREEATRLLDAMKQQEQANREQMARDRLRMNMGQLPPVEKDW